MALLVEVNSVFLHVRQILVIIGVQKRNSFYKINSLLNISTFLVFRIAVLGWMTRWLILNRNFLSLVAYSLGSCGMS